MKQLSEWKLFLIPFLVLTLRLDACPSGPPGPPGPSLIDPKVVTHPLFQYEDRLNNYPTYGIQDLCVASLLEWQEYFIKYKKHKFPLSRLAKTFWPENLSAGAKQLIEENEKITEKQIDDAMPIDDKKYPGISEYLKFIDNDGDGTWAEQNAKDKTLDVFLRAKWAYQAVRSAVTEGSSDYALAISDYDHLMAPLGIDSLVRFRALGYKALALHRTGKTDEAINDYLEMFDQCPGMRYEAQHSLDFILEDIKTLSKISSETKSPHRKVVALYLIQLLSGRDYSAETLAPMIQYGPKEVSAEMAMVRMLQDVERDQLTTEALHFLGQSSENDISCLTPTTRARAYKVHRKNFAYFSSKLKIQSKNTDIQAIIDLCEKAAMNPQIRRPAFWSWAASYLSLLSGDTNRAEKNYESAETLGHKDFSLEPSIHMIGSFVTLAKSPNTFSEDVQKRLLEDIAWAHATNNGHDGEMSIKPINTRMEASLNELITIKYLFQGDWARAIICSSLSPQINGYKMDHVEYLLDLATQEELLKLRSLLFQFQINRKEKKYLQPMDSLLAQTALIPEDITYYLAIRKAKVFDYSSALIEIIKLEKQNAKYMTAVSVTGYYPEDWGPFTREVCKGSQWMMPKTIEFCANNWDISSIEPESPMDLKTYFKKMSELQELLEKGRRSDPKIFAQAAFKLGHMYITQFITDWPDFRAQHDGWYGLTYELAPDDYGMLFHIPDSEISLSERIKRHNDETPDYEKVASQYFQEVIDSKADKEFAAQSVAYLAEINFGLKGIYHKYIDELKTKYRETDFYKRYQPTCSCLQ